LHRRAPEHARQCGVDVLEPDHAHQRGALAAGTRRRLEDQPRRVLRLDDLARIRLPGPADDDGAVDDARVLDQDVRVRTLVFLRRRVRERVLVVPRGVAREAFDDDDGRVQDDVAEDPTPGEQVDQVVPDACAVRLEERAAARPREGEVLDDGAPQQPARPDGADAQFALDPLADPADDEAAHALGAELRLAEHVDGDGGDHEAEEDADDDAERDAERAPHRQNACPMERWSWKRRRSSSLGFGSHGIARSSTRSLDVFRSFEGSDGLSGPMGTQPVAVCSQTSVVMTRTDSAWPGL